MEKAQARKELLKMLEESAGGQHDTMEEVKAHVNELLAPNNIVYMTGDTHGQFDRIADFCADREMTLENTFFILGDAGLNYSGDVRDVWKKKALSALPITFFCIHGNHEIAPVPRPGVSTARVPWRQSMGGAEVPQYSLRH